MLGPTRQGRGGAAIFIFRLFAGSIIGLIIGGVLLVGGAAVLFVVVVGALAVTGGPADCAAGGGPIVVDAAHADAFKRKWDGLSAMLDRGAPSSVTLTESEITSRADSFLKEKDTPFKEPRVCLHEGRGEAQAKISVLGITTRFKVTGTLDMTGAHPKAKIDSINVGNVPSWLVSPAEAVINGALDDALNDVDVDHRYTVAIKAGEAGVAGTP